MYPADRSLPVNLEIGRIMYYTPDEELIWNKTDRELICHTPVYDIYRQREVAVNGMEGDYIVADAPEWIVTIAETEGRFVLVRQWRHSSLSLTTEFPGGVSEPGEDPAVTAARELEEETGYRPGTMTHLGTVSPNPALFSNRVHIYLAEELTQTGVRHLDRDENISVIELPVGEVIKNFASVDYSHAFMGTALALYMRYRGYHTDTTQTTTDIKDIKK